MNTLTIPITDFIRKFGEYSNLLSRVERIILTRDGRPFAHVIPAPEEKNRKLLSMFGAGIETEIENDKIWKKVFTRHNRKHPVKLD